MHAALRVETIDSPWHWQFCQFVLSFRRLRLMIRLKDASKNSDILLSLWMEAPVRDRGRRAKRASNAWDMLRLLRRGESAICNVAVTYCCNAKCDFLQFCACESTIP